MRLSTFLLLFICSYSFAQTNNYQSLLDTAIRGHGSLFLHSKPLKVTRLDPKELWYYFENARDYSNQKLDTVMFSQIIQNAVAADTALWTDNELPNFILINERAETVYKRYVVQKFKLTDKKQIKHFTQYVNMFNSTDIADRVICYYSRPIFDNSKTFAIVQWDNGHSYLGGGGGIMLYQLQSDKTWKEYCVILNWRY
ncbi:MAG: hypothetical protein JST34_03415 [Bacteroidetes bacterium]|nr:hypothetical protein [Bacteroidota bacterium]